MAGLNQSFEIVTAEFEKLFEKYRNEGSIDHRKFLDLFSKGFTRDADGNPSKYKISCAFANYVYENSGYDTFHQGEIKCDGIMYPSVLNRTTGLNLALKPGVVNNRKIELID